MRSGKNKVTEPLSKTTLNTLRVNFSEDKGQRAEAIAFAPGKHEKSSLSCGKHTKRV